MKKKQKSLEPLKKAAKYLHRSSAVILTCIGAVGVVATAILTAKAAPKAMQILDDERERRREELTPKEPLTFVDIEPLTKKEVFVLTWKCYAPAAVIGLSTISCILGANALNRKQQAALASTYALVAHSYSDYKSKVKELYGEEAHQEVLRALAVEKCKDVSLHAECMFSYTCLDFDVEEEERLFYDSFSNRYFQSTISKVLQAEYHLNRNFALYGGEISLNTFYEFLGLEKIQGGDEIGWMVDDTLYWVDFNHSKAVLEDGLECCIIEMAIEPSADVPE